VLYDLSNDPHQMQNLANQDSARSVRQEMERRLAVWMERTGDNWSYNWTHPVEDKGRLYKHRTFRSVSEYLAWAKQHPDLDASN
jgi:hypothetical protein